MTDGPDEWRDGPVRVLIGDVPVLLTLAQPRLLSAAEAAYLAALIDGEGSVECQRQYQPRAGTPSFRLRVSFTMATTEPLSTIAGWLGLRVNWYPAISPNRRPRLRLHIPKGIALRVLVECLPHLILKREQALAILAIERVRAANSPGRRHYGAARLERMPAHAVAEMERLYAEFRRIKAAC